MRRVGERGYNWTVFRFKSLEIAQECDICLKSSKNVESVDEDVISYALEGVESLKAQESWMIDRRVRSAALKFTLPIASSPCSTLPQIRDPSNFCFI
jgi:hypothetical protein